MGARGSGGANIAYAAKPAREAIDPGEWPWDGRRRTKWNRRKIRSYLVTWCRERGLITHEAERDTLNAIASLHWVRYLTMREIEEEGPSRALLSTLASSENRLIQHWRSIGFKPSDKDSPAKGENVMDMFRLDAEQHLPIQGRTTHESGETRRARH